MLTILKLRRSVSGPDAIVGWIVAVDTQDACRQAAAALESELAQRLYREPMEWVLNGPPRGKTELPLGDEEFAYVMLA